MKKIHFLLLASFIVLILGLIWHPAASKHNPSNKLSVVCTTSIIADTLHHIGGDAITVTSLMGPGIDPHLYRARESDVRTLTQADVIFYNGLHLEGKMAHILEKMNAYVPTYAVSAALKPNQLRAPPEFSINFDPHIWLDVQLWIQVVDYCAQVLMQCDQKNAPVYAHNAANYKEELEHLDAYVKQRVAQVPKPQRVLVTAHDAFGYFGASYGFQVVGLQGMSTQTETGLYDITALVDFIVQHKIRALFTESSIPTQAIAAVQQAAHVRGCAVKVGPTLYTDALGLPGSGADTYARMIRHNCDAIVDALNIS